LVHGVFQPFSLSTAARFLHEVNAMIGRELNAYEEYPWWNRTVRYFFFSRHDVVGGGELLACEGDAVSTRSLQR